MKVVGYVRLSKRQDGVEDRFGLAAQRHAIEEACLVRGWVLDRVIEDHGFSAKSLERPGVREALALMDAGAVEGLVVAKLDRLSRSVIDFANLMELAERSGWALVALDMNVDTTTPAGRMVSTIMASFAQFERELISQRTKEALAAKRASGWVPGRPVTIADSTLERIAELRAAGRSMRSICSVLDEEGVPTAEGGPWSSSTIQRVLKRQEALRAA